MHEVHPPQGDIHTWKGFFLHIVTITIGLLIAIALEQMVEYVHHVDQLHAVRRELLAELDRSHTIATHNLAGIDKLQAQLARNMALLRAAQAGHAPPAGTLDYSWDLDRVIDGAWQAARQGGALELMPRDQLRLITFDYDAMNDYQTLANAAILQLQIAGAITHRSADGALTPRDVDELVTATSDVQGRLTFTRQILDFARQGLERTLASR